MNSGIYKIVNTKTGSLYIGSTKNLTKRKKQHFNLLKRGKSKSRILQRAYTKYGEQNFIFEVIAKCPVEYLFKLEQWFVDSLDPRYNICKIDVSVPIGLPYKYTEEHKEQKRREAFEKLKTDNFGWKSRKIESFNEFGVIKLYESLKEFAIENKCSIANVGKALKKNNKCKGFNIRYQK